MRSSPLQSGHSWPTQPPKNAALMLRGPLLTYEIDNECDLREYEVAQLSLLIFRREEDNVAHHLAQLSKYPSDGQVLFSVGHGAGAISKIPRSLLVPKIAVNIS